MASCFQVRATVKCVAPFLDRNKRYVNFGGNLKQHRGRGYAIVGRTRNGWLSRAGYPIDEQTPPSTVWKWVHRMLEDLHVLSREFQFVVAGLQMAEWRSLEEMLEMAKLLQGQKWLDTCRLRIFAPESYLAIWRHMFARKLGFSFIPGGTWDLAEPQPASAVATAEAIKVWLRTQGLNQKQLAQQLGISPSAVSQHLTGNKSWGKSTQQAMERLASQNGD